MFAVALCLFSVLPRAAAHTSTPKIHALLHLEAGSGCVDTGELEEAVEALVERDAIVDRADAELELRVAMFPKVGRWRAQVTLFRLDGRVLGERELVGAGDCHSLDSSLVVIIATLLDAAAPAKPLPHKHWNSVAVGALGQVETGVFPAPLWSAHLFLTASLIHRVEVWLDLGLGLPQRVAASAQGRSATFQNFDSRLAVCPEALGRRALQLFVCAGVMLGAMRGVGEGFDLLRATETRLRGAATLELALRVHLTPGLSVQVGAAPWLALFRPRFYARDGSGMQHSLSHAELVGGGARIVFIVGGP